MSHQSLYNEIPADTAQVARAIFSADNVYLNIGDELDSLLRDTDFSCVYPSQVRPPVSPNLLALMVVFQLREGLSDDQVALNAQARIDWKYALRLSLKAPGVALPTYVDFRQRLLNHQAAMQVFNRLMSCLMELDLGHDWNNLNAVNGIVKNRRPFV